MDRLSVVIPNLNYGRYLRECLESLRGQSFRDFEVFLVDGGSSDCTFDVVKDFPEVKVLMDVPPQGPVKAVNKAIRHMSGEYFTQLNADCVLEPKMYEKCVGLLDSFGDVGLVYTKWKVIHETGEFMGYSKQPKRFSRLRLLQGNYVDSSSMVVRRSVFDRVGLFDERCPWSMDWIMAAKVSRYFRVAFIDEALFRYRVHPEQITRTRSGGEADKAFRIVCSYYPFFERVLGKLILNGKKVGRKLLF